MEPYYLYIYHTSLTTDVIALTHVEIHLMGDLWPGLEAEASLDISLTNVGTSRVTSPLAASVALHAFLSEDSQLDMATMPGDPADTYLGVIPVDQCKLDRLILKPLG